jgi:hypothetical protein
MLDDELPEPPMVLETQALAQKIVTSMVDYLESLGWDYAVVAIARRIDLEPGHAVAPGATAMHADAGRMAPALGTSADALRAMARQLEELHDGQDVTVSSYVHDRSDYASGRRQWPR